MTTEEIRINVSGCELVAKQWGDSNKPVILALHGWLDNAATYDRLAPLLSDYRVVAMDFVGHGYSDHRPEGVRYHMLDNVDDVVGFANVLGLDQFILMGHSMGAGIASLLSGAFPERIKKLILIEGVGTNTTPASEAPDTLRRAVMDMQKSDEKRKPVYGAIAEAVQLRMMALGGISQSAASTLCTRGLEKMDAGFTWRSDPRLKMSSAVRLTNEMIDAYLKRLNMPVLLVTANQSFLAMTDMVEKRVGKISTVTHVQMDGNHHLHLEPETCGAVAQAINRFLDD